MEKLRFINSRNINKALNCVAGLPAGGVAIEVCPQQDPVLNVILFGGVSLVVCIGLNVVADFRALRAHEIGRRREQQAKIGEF